MCLRIEKFNHIIEKEYFWQKILKLQIFHQSTTLSKMVSKKMLGCFLEILATQASIISKVTLLKASYAY